MQRILERLNAALAQRRAGLILLLVLAAGYAVAYFRHPLFPGHDAGAVTRGWWTWTDQSRYLTEGAALATGTLEAASYFYPVGYPALGAIFWRWMPANPFFVPDLLLVLGAAAVWWRLARRWLTGLEALGLAGGFVATHAALLGQTMVVPWNTIATQAGLWAGIWGALAWRGRRAVLALAGLAAATYAVRPIDAVAFGPLLIWATLRLARWRERLFAGGVGAAVIAVAVAAVGALNQSIFGQWRTPYEMASAQTVGFFSYPVSYKSYWLLVDGRPLFGEAEPGLLWRYPWLFLVLPGVIFFVRREGAAAIAVVAAVAVNWLLYLNYNDFLPSDIYRFTLIHYLTWSFPLLILLAAAACRHGWRNGAVRAGFGLALAAVIFCAGIRMEERALPAGPAAPGGWKLPERRPLLVRFRGEKREAVTQLRLDGRTLVEYSGYLVPYVPSDLQLLLGTRTKGTVLSLAEGTSLKAEPAIGEFRWTWHAAPSRAKLFFK